MIRTRDFILYLLVLGFVLLGATYTGLASRTVTEIESYFIPGDSVATAVEAYRVERPQTGQSRWEELRQRLAAGEGYLDDRPAVFTSVDQEAANTAAQDASSTAMVGDRAVQWCGVPLPGNIASWPSATTLSIVEGQRVVFAEETSVVTVGTTTETITEEVVVASLPVRSIRSTFDSCLPDTVIGISAAGQPLLNDQASQYAGFASQQVVGHARDGFSIFGPVADPESLDACGGRYVNNVYQYHVRVDEPFILGCYAGVPAAL
jgi:hypothetical protein